MEKRTLFLFVTCLLLVSPSVARPYDTNSFFLVIIDGLRNQEAFEDSTHQYIPRIWNDLRPLGTIYTNHYTMIRPGTTPGHNVLVSGVRTEMMNNHQWDFDHFRSRYPTIFEYYRKERGVPMDSVWFIAGKRNLGTCNYSLHPAYGSDYGATFIGDAGFDTTTYGVIIDAVDAHHPSLMVINLKDVDRLGHYGIFEDYTRGIQIADSLVYELYCHLQNDNFYSDNVTLFITTDHGRTDDLNGGFQDHGLGTHGDRSCFFLAIGPDIKVDNVAEERTSFIDIAPTAGELMGFATPFAEGTVMRGMLQDAEGGRSPADVVSLVLDSIPYKNLSNSSQASLYPSIAVSESTIIVLWSEYDTSAPCENRLVECTRSTDEGVTWIGPQTVFENYQPDGTVYRADLRRTGENRNTATMCGYYGYDDPLGLRTYRWFVAVSGSGDGSMWDPPSLISGYTSPWRTIILNPPRAAGSGVHVFLDWVVESWFVAKESSDGGSTFDGVADYRKKEGLDSTEFFSSPDVVADADRAYFAIERNDLLGSRIYCVVLEIGTKNLSNLVRLDPDTTLSLRPSLGISNGVLHVVWSDMTAGFLGIYHSMSADGGQTYTDPQLISSEGVDSWNPDISITDDNLVVVWEDYSDGTGEIYSCASTDAGTSWGQVMRETETTGFSVHPRIASREGASYLVWQDYSEGNWDVYVKQIYTH